MNFEKIFKWLNLFLVGFSFVFSTCLAKGIVIENFTPPKKEDVIFMDSYSVDNLKINFLKGTRPGKLVGKIFANSELVNVGDIVYTIKGPSGAVYWEKTQKKDFLFNEDNKSISFSLVVRGLRLPEKSILSVEIFNKKNKLIARGETLTTLQKEFVGPELSNLKVILKEDRAIASFLLKNKRNKPITVSPKLEIYNRDETKLLSEEIGEQIEIKEGSDYEFKLKFKSPQIPQVYKIKAFVVNNNGISLGGELRRNFLVRGIFAQIQSADLLETDVKANEITFVFSGIVPAGTEMNADINLNQEFEGSIIEQKKEHIRIVSDKRGRFKGAVTFEIEKNSDYSIVDLSLSHNGTVIGKKHLEQELIIAPKLKDVIEKQKEDKELKEKVEKVKWWLRKDLLVWGVILLILSLIAINNWAHLYKKFFLVLLSTFFCSNLALGAYGETETGVAPTVWWNYPVESWYYNPNPDDNFINKAGFEYFSKIRMKGQILSDANLDADPLFGDSNPNTKPSPIVLLNFKKGTHDGWFAIDPGDSFQNFDPPIENDYLAVDRSIEFAFEVDIQDTTNQRSDDAEPHQTLQDFLSQGDGEWQYAVYFCMGGGVGDYDCNDVGAQWYGTTDQTLKIDSTSPTLTLVHESDPSLELHKSRIQGLEDGADGLTVKTLERDSKISEKRMKIMEKLQKEQDKKMKVGERIEKTRQREDIIKEIGIINARLTKIEDDLDDPYIPNDEKTKLQTEKNDLETEKNSLNNTKESLRLEIEGVTDTGDLSGTGGLNGEIATLESEISVLTADIQTAQTQIDALNGEILTLKTSIKEIKQTSMKDKVSLAITCNDAAMANCKEANYTVEVNGNFCSDEDPCDTGAIRQFKLCDQAGNCNDEKSNEIDWYDPVNPETTLVIKYDNDEDGIIDNDELAQDGSSSIKSGALLSFKLNDTTDFRRKDTSTVGDDLTFDFNSDACGANPDSKFFAKGDTVNRCLEKVSVCAKSAIERGTINLKNGGECASFCDEGYIYNYDDGLCYLDCDQRNLSICLPGILGRGDCSEENFNDWSPETNTIPSGQEFIQENKCGNRRQVIGTQ